MARRLSEFQGLAGLEVLRDGEFLSTGKLSTLSNGLCVPLRSAKFIDEVNGNSRVAAVITSSEIAEALDQRFAVAVAQDVDNAHNEIHARLAEVRQQQLRAEPNRIDSTAVIDPNSWIAGYGVAIGPRVWIGPNVFVAPGVTIEADCALHAGAALGMPGFNTGIIGGRQRIMPHMGGVRLSPFVELLANVCVARAQFGGDTILGEETVVDNLACIAHDVQIGRRVQICALVNILGRTVIGDDAYIGPSAVVRNGLIIGAKAKVSIGAVVTRDVAADEIVTGNFAIGHERFLEHIRSVR